MADDIWLSPDYDRFSCHITLTLYRPTPQAAHDYFEKLYHITSTSLSLSPRAHWGKYVTQVKDRDLKTAFPRLPDFEKIRKQMDPAKIFTNKALRDDFGFD